MVCKCHCDDDKRNLSVGCLYIYAFGRQRTLVNTTTHALTGQGYVIIYFFHTFCSVSVQHKFIILEFVECAKLMECGTKLINI